MPSVLLYMPANRSHIYWADYTAPSTPWALLNLIHYTANSCLDLPRAMGDVLRKKLIIKKKVRSKPQNMWGISENSLLPSSFVFIFT